MNGYIARRSPQVQSPTKDHSARNSVLAKLVSPAVTTAALVFLLETALTPVSVHVDIQNNFAGKRTRFVSKHSCKHYFPEISQFLTLILQQKRAM
jgi:hypothetical protein